MNRLITDLERQIMRLKIKRDELAGLRYRSYFEQTKLDAINQEITEKEADLSMEKRQIPLFEEGA